MKHITLFLIFLIALQSCKSIDVAKPVTDEQEESLVKNDTVVIDSDENEYEIIIIEPFLEIQIIKILID